MYTQKEKEQLLDLFKKTKLGKIDKSLAATKEILGIIPEQQLIFLIGQYRVRHLAYNSMKERIGIGSWNYPTKKWQEIDKNLSFLKKKGWLTRQGVNIITQELKKQMAFSKKGSEYIAYTLLKNELQTGGRQIDDPNLIVMTMGLMALLELKTGKRTLSLIADFLVEQVLVVGDGGKTTDSLRKLFERGYPNFEKLLKATNHAALIKCIRLWLRSHSLAADNTDELKEVLNENGVQFYTELIDKGIVNPSVILQTIKNSFPPEILNDLLTNFPEK